MADLFDYLDRVERRERPLTPITPELSSDNTFVETDRECPEDGCSGTLWDENGTGDGRLVCGRCSILTGGGASVDNDEDLWVAFRENRPRYSNSNEQRLVGGFNHEWVKSKETDGSVVDLDPEEFYRE